MTSTEYLHFHLLTSITIWNQYSLSVIENVYLNTLTFNISAPAGCLQYHVEKEGIIESLNFFNGVGHYLGDLNYAICFKRYPDTCGIRYVEREKIILNNTTFATVFSFFPIRGSFTFPSLSLHASNHSIYYCIN